MGLANPRYSEDTRSDRLKLDLVTTSQMTFTVESTWLIPNVGHALSVAVALPSESVHWRDPA